MDLRNKSIALVDHLSDEGGQEPFGFSTSNVEAFALDPVRLFSQTDWTRFEEDVNVINKIYSHVFDEIVIARKKLVCFWPLSEQFGGEWFELNSLCESNDWELEVYKHGFFEVDNYGFSPSILGAWKRFVYFLVESLLEDIRLNEDLEEVATLTSGRDSIVLFKLGAEGQPRYTFAYCGEGLGNDLAPKGIPNTLPEFASFHEMLAQLLASKDLSLYQTQFCDPHLEKTYFSLLAKKTGSGNLIEAWLLSYSLN
ncbi:hypothetical protein J0A68_17180 [Algoriphagus sp. H41]|uniref:SMI1 / KNR4 family (SUKH-1) n=1 Tax=Algoriphagus oliviformis TaxID=2811231 RepID=A0ABS3C6G1_9BACT|nr:hypothetical protein [Algoriphagus oliviformis]MBN7812691.1 hypothetical protein [Algoriphagus oliviformis]